MKAPAKAWTLTPVCLLVLACSGGDAPEANDIDSSVAVADASPASESVRPDSIRTDIDVCELLTGEQVATVLPGHEGGLETASGAQLFGDDTRSYKCSYDAQEAGEVYFFTVDLTVGPFGLMSYQTGREMAQAEGDIHREVEIADGGWVEVGDEWLGQGIPYVTVTVLRNPAEISILLMVPDAHEKVDAVVNLAAAVASVLD
jgi:hypothetical protein